MWFWHISSKKKFINFAKAFLSIFKKSLSKEIISFILQKIIKKRKIFLPGLICTNIRGSSSSAKYFPWKRKSLKKSCWVVKTFYLTYLFFQSLRLLQSFRKNFIAIFLSFFHLSFKQYNKDRQAMLSHILKNTSNLVYYKRRKNVLLLRSFKKGAEYE